MLTKPASVKHAGSEESASKIDQNSLVEAPVPICIFTNHHPSQLDPVKDSFGVAFKCLILINCQPQYFSFLDYFDLLE